MEVSQLPHGPDSISVVMVCESALIEGGAEKVAVQESIELRNRGYRVGFISAGTQADSRLIEAGVEVLLLGTHSFFEETNRTAKFQRLFCNSSIESKVKEYLQTFSSSQTVVHLHTFRLKLSGTVAHVAQQMGFATLIHAHDYSPACPTSLFFDHRAGQNCNRKPLSFDCIRCECQNEAWKYKLPKVTSQWWNQKVWKINQRSQGILHISNLEQETLCANLDSSIPNFRVPPISSLNSQSRVECESNQNVLCIGRITYEKGVDAFLSACDRAGIAGVVIGDGPLRKTLEAQYPKVRFTGWLSPDQVEAELGKARAIVVPSRWRETLGLSVIDAMTLGVPCVVTPNVGASEYIKTGINGLISDENNLMDALSQLKSDDFVKSLSEQAFLDFQQNPMSVESHVDALGAIYKSCLKTPHGI